MNYLGKPCNVVWKLSYTSASVATDDQYPCPCAAQLWRTIPSMHALALLPACSSKRFCTYVLCMYDLFFPVSSSKRFNVSMFPHAHMGVRSIVVKSCSLSLSLTHFIYNTVLFLCFHCRRNKLVYTYKTHKKDTARMSDFNAVDLPAVVWCCYLSAVVRVDVLGGRGGERT